MTKPKRKPSPLRTRVLILLLGGLIVFTLFKNYPSDEELREGQPEATFFYKLLKDHSIDNLSLVTMPDGSRELQGTFLKNGRKTPITTGVDLAYDHDLKHVLDSYGYTNIPQVTQTTPVFLAVLPYLPAAIMLGFMGFYFFAPNTFRKGLLNFGKMKLRQINPKIPIKFKDVAGVEESKESLSEIVEFLKDPKRFNTLGGRIPKGILMIGPPGTGKTMLAKAMAGEANVPCFGISGSDFVEMFSGVGAARVRDMFEQGKKEAPCIIFIDELDAVGRHRSSGGSTGHEEREQTLNALLVEMDGVETNEGVIIIAATNRKDVLDPALMRPGRFDREVHVRLPDIKGREAILQAQATNIKLDPKVNLKTVARGTPGFSGAELANLLNEAALKAASHNHDTVTQHDLDVARDQVRWGKERKSLAMTEEEKIRVAYHEAGHTIIIVFLDLLDPLHKVTIIPRGPGLGLTMWLPEEDEWMERRKKVLNKLVLSLGGRLAEEIFLGDISNGAAGDLTSVTDFVEKMYYQWGMFPDVNCRVVGPDSILSEAHKQQLDTAIQSTVMEAYNKARELILKHKADTELIAKALLDRETLDAAEVYELLKLPYVPPTAETVPRAEIA